SKQTHADCLYLCVFLWCFGGVSYANTHRPHKSQSVTWPPLSASCHPVSQPNTPHHTHTNTLLTPQDQNRKAPEIRINQIGETIKQNYITHWKTQTKTQSKMQFSLALN